MAVVKTKELLGGLTREEAAHAPESLYLQGERALFRNRVRVALVGSRDADEGALEGARRLTALLTREGATVVSGLARGVDRVAHEEAMRREGRTIAVLGTPLERAYPAEHASLQKKLAREQLVVSEFSPSRRVTRRNFILRDRTMALLSDGVVVAAAGSRSGTKHVVEEALRLSVPVFFAVRVMHGRVGWVRHAVRRGAFVLRSRDLAMALDVVRRRAEGRRRERGNGTNDGRWRAVGA